MRLTSKQCDKYFGHLESHEYRGYNKALGKYIEGKEHFIHEMEKGGYVPYEMGERLAEQHRKDSKKDYRSVSEKTLKTIHQLKETVDSKGRLSSLSGTKRACEEVGIKFDRRLPQHYQDIKVGGFEDGER